MAMVDHTNVMDISTRSSAKQLDGSREWLDDMLSRDEMRRLDNHMGVALLDTDVRNRLVNERDQSLFVAYGLSERTQNWLHEVQARTLNELARAIVSRTQSAYAVTP